MGDVTKLPKWAQRLINNQQMRLAEKDKLLTQHAGKVSNVVANEGMLKDSIPFAYLPDDATVDFHTNRAKREWVQVRMQRDGTVLVYSSGRISIEPRSSNSFIITPEDFS